MREDITDNLNSAFYGIDVHLNRRRERSNVLDSFVYKTYDEIYSMSIEELRSYAKVFRNGWKYLIVYEEGGIGLVYVTSGKCFMHSMIILLLFDLLNRNF